MENKDTKFYEIEKSSNLIIINKKWDIYLKMNSFYYENIKSVNNLNIIEKNSYGIYFIEDLNSSNLYLGETRKGLERFWGHKAIEEMDKYPDSKIKIHFMRFSESLEINKEILNWLEVALLKKFKSSGFNLLNKSFGERPKLSESNIDFSNEILNLIIEYLEFANIFIEESKVDKEIFYFKNNNVNIKIKKTPNGILLLKGSEFNDEILKNTRENGQQNIKNFLDLIDDDISNGVLGKDFHYRAPSVLTDLGTGKASTNGWFEFKNSDGKTLHEIYRLNGQSTIQTRNRQKKF